MIRRWSVALLTLGLVLGATALARAGTVRFEGAIIQGNPVKPSTLWLSADGTLVVLHMRWSSWGGPIATGKGTAEYHGCTPSCGAAPIHHERVTVHLSNLRVCRGQAYYDRVSVRKHDGGNLSPSYEHWAPC